MSRRGITQYQIDHQENIMVCDKYWEPYRDDDDWDEEEEFEDDDIDEF